MKKIFIYSSIIFLFVVGITILPTHKSEAAVTASIYSVDSRTSVKVGDPSVSIRFNSAGADSCTVTLNGSVISSSTSGGFSLSTSNPGSYTYRIECRHLVVEPKYYYYQLSPCYSGNPAAEYYAPAGAWQSGTLVQGASGVYYTVAGSNNTDDPNKWNVSGITRETNWALCR